ncbi:MAG: hypothetical protein RL120_00445 [Gammaproteobacteria bacterium]
MSEHTPDKREQNATEPELDTGSHTIIPPASPNKLPLGIWIGLSALLIIALAVIVVLPAVVTEYELPLERRVDLAESQPPAQAQVESVSPFREAQLAIQRREAQDVLAAVLQLQESLTAKEVQSWGQAGYESALEQASIGDQYYRNQDFQLALQSYENSRDGLQALVDSIPTVLQRVLIDGRNALNNGDALPAREAFSLALLLDPESEAAQVGMQRSNNLEQVAALLASAEDQVDDGDLQSALQSLQRARQLDPYDEAIGPMIQDVNDQVLENQFASIMSAGYNRLGDGDPEGAIAEFRRAANLGINQDQALAAITQTENEIASVQISRLRDQISAAESGERWQEAADYYSEVLAIDPNLTFATQGLDYTQKRAHLDTLLQDAITNPVRFAEEQVFQETLDVYYTGQALENPGPRLTAQLAQLRGLLEESQVPLDVHFISDNLTQVSLQRVGELGNFEQTTLNLKPGRYVAIGRRTGFREVREEFTVGFGQTPESITIRCEERVIATRR